MLQSIGPGCYGNSHYLVSSGNILEQCIGEIGGFVPESGDRLNLLLFLLLLLLSSFRRSEAVMDGQQLNILSLQLHAEQDLGPMVYRA